MPTKLPSRVFNARTVRVHTVGRVEVELKLGFGVVSTKHVLLEGFNPRRIPMKHRNNAQHCLIVLLGGKNLLAHISDADNLDGHVPARIFVDDRSIDLSAEYTAVPYGLVEPYLEVTKFMECLATVDYDVNAVHKVINSKKKKRKQSAA